MLQLRAGATLREGLWKESKGKSRGADGGKGYACGKGKTMKGTEKKGSGKSGGPKEGPSGEAKSWGYQGRCWTCGRVGHKSAECECGVGHCRGGTSWSSKIPGEQRDGLSKIRHDRRYGFSLPGEETTRRVQ